MQRRVTQRQRAALTNADQIHLSLAANTHNLLHAVVQVTIHVIVQFQIAIRSVRRTPFDQEYIDVIVEQAPD